MKRQSIILHILIVLVLVAALCIIFLASPSDPDTAAVILPAASESDDENSGDDEDTDSEEILSVTRDSVQTVIRTLSPSDSYSRTVCTESFWSGGESRRNIDVWVRNDEARIDISASDGSSTRHILIIGGEKWLWDSDSDGLFHGAAAENEAELYQSILNYEHILELDKSAITDAGFVEYLGEMCIYVRYVSGRLGYENVCYISLASGLVTGEESYDGETLIYRMSSTTADLSVPPDSVFELP